MKLRLGLVRFDRGLKWPVCLVCRSAPGGKPKPGTMVYYAAGERVCDSCVRGGPEEIMKALQKKAYHLQRKADRFREAANEGIEVGCLTLEDEAKARVWGRRRVENHFGVCPVCGDVCPYLNVGQGQWFYCAKHGVCWCGGTNLFSSWREEDEATWAQNEEKLEGYRVVYESVEEDLDLIPEEEAWEAATSHIGENSPWDYDMPF